MSPPRHRPSRPDVLRVLADAGITVPEDAELVAHLVWWRPSSLKRLEERERQARVLLEWWHRSAREFAPSCLEAALARRTREWLSDQEPAGAQAALPPDVEGVTR